MIPHFYPRSLPNAFQRYMDNLRFSRVADCVVDQVTVSLDGKTVRSTCKMESYLAKKRAEGKHYNIALSHAAKKLVRLIFALEKSGLPYCPAI